MRAIGLALAIAALGTARTARAECGGDSGDSGSSSSSGSDSGDAEPACEEVSPVVGRAICRRFGSWDASRRPAIRVAGGASILRIPVGSMSFAGSAEHSDAPAMSYAVSGEEAAATGGAFDLQITAGLGRHLYAGIEGSIGGLSTGSMASPTTAESLLVSTRSLVYMAAAGVAGAAVSLGDYQLRGEVGVGVRAVSLSVETRHDECVLSSSLTDAAPLVRPRLSAQRWVSPWLSIGASAATNLAARGETSLGLFVGGHLRAFR